MAKHVLVVSQRYEASLDRAGLSLGAGAGLGGLLVVGLLLAGGQYDPMSLSLAWLIGALIVGLGITAFAGPLWLVLHVAGLRRWHHAAALGAVTAMAIFVGAQTYGFGQIDMPAMDGRTLAMRWTSAFITSALLAALAAGIGAVMWRIAYRPVQ